MASMNAFEAQVFNTIELTGVVNKMDYQPMLLGSMNIFETRPIRTLDVMVDRRDGVISLIPASERGAPPVPRPRMTRDAVSLRILRLAKDFTVFADEVQSVRAFGSESELDQVADLFMREMARIQIDMETTFEHMRLGAIQGVVLDADGSTVLHDFYSIFNEPQASEIDFELDDDATDVQAKSKEVVRGMARDARGSFVPGTTIHALCGDEFYDALATHPAVKETYLNFQAAESVRANPGGLGAAFESFRFGGITYHNYRGTDDNSTVAVPSAKAKFFPVGARDMFEVAYGPAEFEPFVNTPGQQFYAMNLRDPSGRNAFRKGELYSYPLFMCKQPRVLRRAKLA